jgi:hypothetical protein
MSKRICLKADLLFEEFNGKAVKQEKEITNKICALLNTTGGTLDIAMDNFDKKTIHDLIRTIEQRFTNIIGGLKTSENILQELAVTSQGITFVITALKHHLCTLSYNLFLPSATGAQSIEPNEPIAAIERIVEGKRHLSHRVLTRLGSHLQEFESGEQIGDDFELNSNIVCKQIKGPNVQNDMTNRQSKFQSQVSAFANDTGGHIYHGIKNGKVTGVFVNGTTTTIAKIASEVEKALGKLTWGAHERPIQKRDWDIYFEPVKDEDGNIINQTFVIVVSVAPYQGGVFVGEPDCHHVVDGETKRMCFSTWKKELLGRRTLRQCNCVDEHVASISARL